jgi:hypothetical protein
VNLKEKELQIEFEEAHKIFVEKIPSDNKEREAKVLLKLTKALQTKAGIPSHIVL